MPEQWRPWFQTIHSVFTDHAQLVSIRQELNVARRMQEAILPTRFPNRPDVHLFGSMRPAKEVGGDFYDFFWLGEGVLGFVIADVSGKGVPAALFMAVSRTLLRAVAAGLTGPGACLAQANTLLAQDNDAAMFVTVFYGALDIATGRLVYANAGHPSPCLCDAGGRVIQLAGTGGTALGVIEDLPYREAEALLAPGSLLVMFTDGVSEAFDPAQAEFGEGRLVATLEGLTDRDAQAAVDTVVAAVDAFAAGAPQADDLTCLALKWFGPLGPNMGDGAQADRGNDQAVV